jgi:site-specific DNA recombinase
MAAEARREITTCDAKLRQHRAALEAGADPALVTSWMAEVQALRAAAESRLHRSPQRRRMSPGDIAQVVAALGDLVVFLTSADPAQKAETYGQLDLRLTYRPGDGIVKVEVRPAGSMYARKCPRSESPPTYIPAIPGELILGGSQ